MGTVFAHLFSNFHFSVFFRILLAVIIGSLTTAAEKLRWFLIFL